MHFPRVCYIMVRDIPFLVFRIKSVHFLKYTIHSPSNSARRLHYPLSASATAKCLLVTTMDGSDDTMMCVFECQNPLILRGGMFFMLVAQQFCSCPRQTGVHIWPNQWSKLLIFPKFPWLLHLTMRSSNLHICCIKGLYKSCHYYH